MVFIKTVIASNLNAPVVLSVQLTNDRSNNSAQISCLPGWEDTRFFFSVYLWQIHTILRVHESNNQ